MIIDFQIGKHRKGDQECMFTSENRKEAVNVDKYSIAMQMF